MVASGEMRTEGATGAWQIGLLCFVVTMFEGFDLQIIGVLAPGIRLELALTPMALGGVFGAATLGLLCGAMGLGIFGGQDRAQAYSCGVHRRVRGVYMGDLVGSNS